MQAGQLRHRITISTQVETKTPAGGYAQGDPNVIWWRVPARVEQLSGRSLQQAMQIDPRLRYSIELRYLPDVKAGQIVTYHAFDGDHVLEIVPPPTIEEKSRAMTLLCGEAQA